MTTLLVAGVTARRSSCEMQHSSRFGRVLSVAPRGSLMFGVEEKAKFPNQFYQFSRVWFRGDLCADFVPTFVVFAGHHETTDLF